MSIKKENSQDKDKIEKILKKIFSSPYLSCETFRNYRNVACFGGRNPFIECEECPDFVKNKLKFKR